MTLLDIILSAPKVDDSDLDKVQVIALAELHGELRVMTSDQLLQLLKNKLEENK